MFITKAAIMYQNGQVIEGKDYGQIKKVARKLDYPTEMIEGFVTSSGDFVTPREAMGIAINVQQIQSDLDELTPELLWPVERVE